MIHFVEFLLDFFKDPRVTSCESLNIVELETLAVKSLDLGRVEVNVFFGENVIIFSVDFDDELILWRGQVVSPYFLQRCKASDGDRLGKE